MEKAGYDLGPGRVYRQIASADAGDSLPVNLADIFDTVRAGIHQSVEAYINLCSLLERLAKRNLGVAADTLRLSLALQALTETSKDTYAIDTDDVPLLNEGILSTAKHLSASQSLLVGETRTWDDGVIEDFKRQRDTLVSMRDMFDRRDRLARDNIPQLEKRIESNQSKLTGLKSRPEGTVKPGEVERVEQSIITVRHAFDENKERAYRPRRTRSRSSHSTREVSSSRSAFGTRLFTSINRSIMSASCI